MEELIYVVIAFAIAIALFLLLRSIILWYWKVDTIVSSQQETNRLLQKLIDKNHQSQPTE